MIDDCLMRRLHLKAVSKVDVEQLARKAVQHEVGGVPVPQAQEVAHHAHDTRAACVVRPPIQPDFAVAGLEPQHPMQIVPC